MKCPLDQTELKMMDRQGVEIDYCPQCRGVWLDRGEIDKLIERSMTAYTPSPQYERDRDRDYRSQGYDTRKRKRGFLGELFDFD